MIENLGMLVAKRAKLTPDGEALVFPETGKRVNFAELNRLSNRVAHSFMSLNIERGDRIGILAKNCLEFVATAFAAMKLGVVIVPLNWRLLPSELDYIVNQSGLKLLLFSSDQSETAESLYRMDTQITRWIQFDKENSFDGVEIFETLVKGKSELEPIVEIAPSAEDDLYIMYTSGTTGQPKGAIHTHSSFLWAIITVDSCIEFKAEDKHITAAPLFHAAGFTPLMVNVYRGITSVVLQQFDPERMWEVIAQESVTCGLMVPTMLQFIEKVPDFETRFDVSQLRWIHCGGGPVPTAMAGRFMERGIALLQVYGQTEIAGFVGAAALDSCVSRADSAGKAGLHVDLKIVDEYGNECDPGEPGELLVSGKCVMRGYWNEPVATAETIQDGWLHTGDVASIDNEGFVTISDRLKDVIISGGENIYPAELEDCIIRHPKVLDVSVIGQSSDKWGESPLAIIVPQDPSLTQEDLLSYCSDKLASFKQPKNVIFVDALPRNASGKILKRELRNQYTDPAPV